MSSSRLELLEAALSDLAEVKKLNDTLQSKYEMGSSEWHKFENIDDTIFEAAVYLERQIGLIGEAS